MAIPWVLTGVGWRQPRIDGTHWMQSPHDPSQLIPDPNEVDLLGAELTQCPQGHKYRMVGSRDCPDCDLSSTVSRAAATSDHQEPTGGIQPPISSDGGAIPASKPEKERAPDSKPTDRAEDPNKQWVTIAWIVGILFLVVAATRWDGIENWLGTSSSPPMATADSPNLGIATDGVSVRTTTTSFDPDEGWQRGACVQEVGVSVRIVSCSLPNDGQVIATALSASSCPSGMTHTVDLENGVACLRLDEYVIVEGFDASKCAFNGIPLYGSVYFTETGIGADMIIAFEESSFLADLTVVPVDSSFQANRCGLWHVVDSAFQADFVVGATERTFGADFTIAVGESTFEAGP